MFNLLEKYIAKNIIIMFFFILLTFTGLFCLFTLLPKLSDVGRGSFGYTDAFLTVLYQLPTFIYEMFPYIVLLSCILGLGLLASSSELTIIRVAGYSKLRIAIIVIKTFIPLIILIMAINEFIAPNLQQKEDILKAKKSRSEIVYVNSLPIWSKFGDEYIYMMFDPSTKKIKSIKIWKFNNHKTNKLESITQSNDITYESDRSWLLKNVKIIKGFDSSKLVKEQVDSFSWKSSFTPLVLTVASFSKHDGLSMRDLYKYILYLESTNQSSLNERLTFDKKLFYPANVFIMILLGMAFLFGSFRSGNLGVKLLMGFSLGACFYLANQIIAPLLLQYGVLPIFGVLIPISLFTMFGVYLMLRKH